MFSKLLKYDLRATARIIPFSYLVLIALYLVAYLVRFTVGNRYAAAYALPVVLFGIADVAMLILTLVLVIAHYYRTMFGQTSYWTHTLPATKSAIFFSKFLTGFIWLLLSIILFFIGLLGVVTLVSSDPATTLRVGWEFLRRIPVSLTLLFLSLWAMQFVLFVASVTGSMTLANIGPFAKNGVAFSFLFYIAVFIIQNLIDLLALLLIPLGFVYSLSGGTQLVFESMLYYSATPDILLQMGLGSIIVDFLMTVGLIVLSIQLLKRRVAIR